MGADICVSIKTPREKGITNGTTIINENHDSDEATVKPKNHKAEGAALKAIRVEKHAPEGKGKKAVSSDSGVKKNTVKLPNDCGREAIAHLVDIIVDETTVLNLDGTTSLNGFGDLVERILTTKETKKSHEIDTLTPVTRSGY